MIELPRNNMTRQEYWKSKGYTDEQIKIHLEWERRKAKESRERKKKNNEKNRELIKEIKENLVGEMLTKGKMIVVVLSIRETTDGVGFWIKIRKTFPDKSSGEFRYFHRFDEYDFNELIDNLFM